jgi:hypothetical protein
MLKVRTGFSMFFYVLWILLLLFSVSVSDVKAQDIFVDEKEVPAFVYDEIPVNVIVEGVGSYYLEVIYTNSGLLYINIEELFHTLNIPCKIGQRGDSLGGFIENESKPFMIDYIQGRVKVGSRTIIPSNGLVKESGALFMESSLFADAFGIIMTFNYRSLSINLKTNFELPILKQMRIDKMRNNLSKVRHMVIADTVVNRNYHLFKVGTLDWLVSSTQTWNGQPDNHLRLGIGTELFYGEADVSVDYYNKQKFDNRWVQYLWRWVDNDKKIVRQAQAGKISNQTISYISAPVVGAVIRNSPTTVRKATGYYTISEVTEPNWTVELYINNVLVDYTQADASGSYTFKVPIVYGYTTLKLKYYGLQGEERTEERTMNVPYSVMPVNEFEYGLSAGVVQDSSHSRFGRADFNYGVSRLLTVGGGLEYLSSITTGAYIPFVKATLQPFSSLTLNAEYAYGVSTRALLNYNFGKNAVLEIDYANYVDGQRATIFNANEERKIKLSVPFRYKKINGFFKLDYSQMIYSEFYYNQGNAMVSAYYNQFSANTSLQMNWVGQKTPFITNEMSVSYRMRNGFIVRPSARYNISENSIMSCKAEIEKRISKAYLLLSYEQYFTMKDHYVNLTFRYDLPFARASASVAQSRNKVMTSGSAQGSLAFGGDKYTHVSNNSSVSKGGILLYPFLDLNRNGVFDKGEHMVKLNTVKLSGGRAIYNEKDSIVRIPDLNAFISYTIEFSDKDLESISWRFKNKIYSILVDPNQFKRVDVPVLSVGEVSGMTYIDKNNELKGLGRIILKFLDKSSNIEVAQTLSESDGYVYYLGLEPGDYVACIDSAQLSNLGFTVDPPCREFTIKTSEDGDIVGGLDFILRPAKDDLLQSQAGVKEPATGSTGINDSLELLKAILEKINVEKEVVSPETETITKLIDTTNLPVKPNPAELAMVEKLVSPDTQNVVLLIDTISLPVKSNPEHAAKGKSIIVSDSLKITLPVPLHRIDQPSSANKNPAYFAPGDTLFKVQLLALPKPLTDKNYFTKLMENVPGLVIEETLGEDGLYHYSTKAFTGIAEAAKYQKMIRKSGWKDSFVAKYTGERRTESAFRKNLPNHGIEQDNNVPPKQLAVINQDVSSPNTPKDEPSNVGKSINFKERNPASPYSALQQENAFPVGSKKLSQVPGDTIYGVQLLAISKPIIINNYFALLLSKIPGLKISENIGEDGIYRYTADTFTSMEKAQKFNALIRQSGWVDSFITTYVVAEKRN